MTPASPSSVSALPALTDESALSATLDRLLKHLTVPTQGAIEIPAPPKLDNSDNNTWFKPCSSG
ncbi:hypothetical protein ACKFKG_29175 [Phormidesmis sp. 146-35]